MEQTKAAAAAEDGSGKLPWGRDRSSKQVHSPDLNKPLLERSDKEEEGNDEDGNEEGKVEEEGDGEENEGVLLCKIEEENEVLCNIEREILCNLRSKIIWLGLFADYRKHFKSNNVKTRVTFALKVFISGLVFCVLAVVLPILNGFSVKCDNCEDSEQQPFQRLVDASESCLSCISFSCLLYLLWKHGLRDILFLDDVYVDMEINSESRHQYMEELKA